MPLHIARTVYASGVADPDSVVEITLEDGDVFYAQQGQNQFVLEPVSHTPELRDLASDLLREWTQVPSGVRRRRALAETSQELPLGGPPLTIFSIIEGDLLRVSSPFSEMLLHGGHVAMPVSGSPIVRVNIISRLMIPPFEAATTHTAPNA